MLDNSHNYKFCPYVNCFFFEWPTNIITKFKKFWKPQIFSFFLELISLLLMQVSFKCWHLGLHGY